MLPEKPCANVRVLRSMKRGHKENESATATATSPKRKSRRIDATENGSESPTYKRFMRNVEEELKLIDDNEDNNGCCTLIELLTQMSEDVSELVESGEIHHFDSIKKTTLIDAVMQSVDAAKNSSIASNSQNDANKKSIDKIVAAAEASLLVCKLYSASKETSPVLNDNMKKIVKFVRLQMRETIFPRFDLQWSPKDVPNKSTTEKWLIRKIQILYAKLVETIDLMFSIFGRYSLIDSIAFEILAVSVKSLFVQNIAAMQMVCFELITLIFRTNVNCRNRIFSNILTSIDRMPHSKPCPRLYKLAHNGECIQRITALVLQLIQISIDLPGNLFKYKAIAWHNTCNKFDAKIISNWTATVSFVETFLMKFFGKCNRRLDDTDCLPAMLAISNSARTTMDGPNQPKIRTDRIDYRPLFESFVNDLLTTVNDPMWPASDLLLNQLGTMLMKCMSDKRTKHSMRIVALKCLGIIAARMRKCAIATRRQKRKIDELIKQIVGELVIDSDDGRTAFLQDILLDFLTPDTTDDYVEKQDARYFYWTQLFNDVVARKLSIAPDVVRMTSGKQFVDESSTSVNDNLRWLDERKMNLLSKFNADLQSQQLHNDYNDAHLIAQYLTSKRQYSQNRGAEYMQKIMEMLREPSTDIQTQAMKCLAMIAEVDPSILAQKEVPEGVQQSFAEVSISLRATTIDMIGKCVIKRPDLFGYYYGMLSMWIRDTSVSVRKQIIKIFRDICIVYPKFEKVPEICVKMIKLADEDVRVRKMIADAFIQMWFTPCADRDQASVDSKINQMLDVISVSPDASLNWINYLTSEEKVVAQTDRKNPQKHIAETCRQISNRLSHVFKTLDAHVSTKALSVVKLMYLLTKFRPTVLVEHVITLQPALNVAVDSQNGINLVCGVAELLEEIVPLIEHPSEKFLTKLKVHLMKLVLTQTRDVARSCLSCLSAIVNKMTTNYTMIRRICAELIQTLVDSRNQLQSTPNTSIKNILPPELRRRLFTIGLIFRFFDFKQARVYGEGSDIEVAGLPSTICNDVFEHLLFFASLTTRTEIRREALLALGHFCITNFEFLKNAKLCDAYRNVLTSDECDINVKIAVFHNIKMYLVAADASEVSSDISGLYLNEILCGFLDANENVRSISLEVVQQILRHRFFSSLLQTIPYLICLGTDWHRENVNRAIQQLTSICMQYPQLVVLSSISGLQFSLQLQMILQNRGRSQMRMVRGYAVEEGINEQPTAVNGFQYTLVSPYQNDQRSFIDLILVQFDGQRSTIQQMVYLVDNLAYFPYERRDEVLYILEKINTLMDTEHSDGEGKDEEEEDEEDEDHDLHLDCYFVLLQNSQPIMLLLALQQHLQAMYNITYSEILDYYSSIPNKTALQKYPVPVFQPKNCFEKVWEVKQTVGKNDLPNRVWICRK